MDQIMVSVICLAYNHEKYIRQCLDGFVMQKTSFRYEVLIHDDASTDHTADIIREYEANYPDLIKPVYQTENQYSKHVGITKTFLAPKVRGKYVAFCEGDDYWSDENKLQLQYDAMQRYPECSLCVHRVQGIKENGRIIANRLFPNDGIIIHTGIIEQNEFFSLVMGAYPFQTSGYFVRANKYLEYMNNPPKFSRVSDVGDVPMLLFFGNAGPVYYLEEVLSAYRMAAIGSWNSRVASDKDKLLAHVRSMISMYQSFDAYSKDAYKQFTDKGIEHYRIIEKQLTLPGRDFLRYLIKENRLKYPKTHRLRFYTKVVLDAYFPALLRLLLKAKKYAK